MKMKILLFSLSISTLLLTGCQNSNITSENEALRQKVTELEQQITELKEASANNDNRDLPNATVQSSDVNTSVPETNGTTSYTLEELTILVEEFVVKVGSATPDVTNSGNLDQFFSLKTEADQIERVLESHENSLESQYRAGTISKEKYRNLDKELDLLEDHLDSAKDRLEIAFGIDD